ncbi:MAG TPA: amidohydrolase family protein [Candidatus Saccharimonadales bacterium]|nr:amidohydrolase family protein [Candidatus Saccharimonadales bacterium]
MKEFVRGLLVFAVFLIPALATQSEDSPPIALLHATTIDRHGRAAQPDQTIIIAGNQVVAEGPANQTKVPKNALVVDASGKFVISGLWDMHVHIAGLNAEPAWSKEVLLPVLLASGIVGVRDMGGDLAALGKWRTEVQNHSLAAPAIVASGAWLAAGGKRTREQIPVANADEARAAVREIKVSGADFVKIISLPSRDAFFAVAEEAKKQNIAFVGHLPFTVSALEASNAGMKSIEHLFYSGFSVSVSSKEAELRPRLVAAQAQHNDAAWEQIRQEAEGSGSPDKALVLAQAFQRNGTWLTPTLASLEITGHPERWNTEDPSLAFVPAALAAEWRALLKDEKMKRNAAWLARQSAGDGRLAAALFHAGVPILAGSDSLDPFVFPGDSLHRELAELVRAGLTPLEALQAATSAPEKYLRSGGAVSRDSSGASFVVLDANPLVDIANTRKISAVVYGGKYLDRAKLDSMLAGAKSAAAAVK